VALLLADLLLEVGDLNGSGGTVWLGSISTEKTSPFRFFMLIFMIFQISIKHGPPRLQGNAGGFQKYWARAV
jgi:hypothetical protein